MDRTTVSHLWRLLGLPPVPEVAMHTRRSSSPRSLYEVSEQHSELPEEVASLVAGADLLTPQGVAEIRNAVSEVIASDRPPPEVPKPTRLCQLLARATGLCSTLDAALVRLSSARQSALPDDDLMAWRKRVALLASASAD